MAELESIRSDDGVLQGAVKGRKREDQRGSHGCQVKNTGKTSRKEAIMRSNELLTRVKESRQAAGDVC